MGADCLTYNIVGGRNKTYDVIIIGGGISGLYAAYLLKKYSSLDVLLLEASGNLGGRVNTIGGSGAFAGVECGAGRFSHYHTHLIALLKNLKLVSKMKKINGGFHFMFADGSGKIQNDTHNDLDGGFYFSPAGVDFSFQLDGNGISDISQVISEAHNEDREVLIGMTFMQYAMQVLGDEKKVEFIYDTFGYTNELLIMNAYDAVTLISTLWDDSYYGLSGGMQQVIDGLVDYLRGGRGRGRGGGTVVMKKRCKVADISFADSELFDIACVDGHHYFGKKCICALNKTGLLSIDLFRNGVGVRSDVGLGVRNMINSVVEGSLCRIYAIYPVTEDGNNRKTRRKKDRSGGRGGGGGRGVWFAGLSKFTVNNDIRMVIPIDEKKGVIMASYSDGDIADSWWKLYGGRDGTGEDEVNNKLRVLLSSTMGFDIGPAKKILVCYWKAGVGYWSVGADSHYVSRNILRPFGELPLFICGENYSQSNQQWMEGALETAHKVVEMIV